MIKINVMFASREELRGVHQLRETLKDEGICADCGPVVHLPPRPPTLPSLIHCAANSIKKIHPNLPKNEQHCQRPTGKVLCVFS